MDPEWREPTAFEIVLDTFCDECEVEFVENNSLPVVIDPRNPFDFNITYRDKVWYPVILMISPFLYLETE